MSRWRLIGAFCFIVILAHPDPLNAPIKYKAVRKSTNIRCQGRGKTIPLSSIG